MAAPNLLTTSNVTGRTAYTALTTVTANVVTNSAASNTVDKVNEIIVCNFSTSTITANVMVNRSATIYYYAGNISIPANSTLTVLAKDTAFYLEEGDVVQANVSANSAAHISVSYELMT